ncbi:MAG: hypothetical protein AB7T63_03825 [Planctomycetota bacterium]
MPRFTVAAAILLVAALAAPCTPAQASNVISGQIGGEEVLPDMADGLRKLAAIESELHEALAFGRRIRSHELVQAAQASFQQVQTVKRGVIDLLRMADTMVYVYGDAAQRVDRAWILRFLRADPRHWRLSSVHIFQRDGKLLWSQNAPIGYDDSNVPAQQPTPAARPTGMPPLGTVIDVGGVKAVPLNLPALGQPSKPKPKPTPPAPPRQPGRSDPTAGTLFGF